LFLCTQRRQQQADAHCHLPLFCFSAPRENNNMLLLIIIFFLFCLCAPRVDNEKLGSSLACHCFHSL
jgi:hypothetical protein